MLTWKEKTILKIDPTTLDVLAKHSIRTDTGEGWGITHSDNGTLVISDGSSNIYFIDRHSLREKRRVEVHLGDTIFPWINELEFVDGYIYANVWYTETQNTAQCTYTI
jgi:glutamine cyclotransferase